MYLFPSSWELYSHPFLWEKISIPRNVLYRGIKYSKLVTNIGMYISIVLFPGIYEYNLKQTHPQLFNWTVLGGCLKQMVCWFLFQWAGSVSITLVQYY